MKNRTLWTALAGYAAGLATAGLIALLMPSTHSPSSHTPEAPSADDSQYSADNAATSPVPSGATAAKLMSEAAGSPAVAPQDIPQHSAAPLSAEVRGRIAPLQAKLAADPNDFATRKQLAVILLQNQQLMAAYEHSMQILATHPDDPDGLYVHAVVRLAMGHATKTLELLDRVLARYPQHAMALQARAEAQRKIGDETGAALSEAKAQEAARGNKSDVEQLLAAAESGTLIEMMRSSSDVGLTSSGEASTAEEGANGESSS